VELPTETSAKSLAELAHINEVPGFPNRLHTEFALLFGRSFKQSRRDLLPIVSTGAGGLGSVAARGAARRARVRVCVRAPAGMASPGACRGLGPRRGRCVPVPLGREGGGCAGAPGPESASVRSAAAPALRS
jgi:hypothetical protein